MSSANALYTDLSGYYDLMCADINYQEQSAFVHRLQQVLGNGHTDYLDLACGTGPHVRHFIDMGYAASGIDINQPMLDIALLRCPEAHFSVGDMGQFTLDSPIDLISCFLYSIHYNQSIDKLTSCIKSVHDALNEGGLFCFNSVDKNTIDNRLQVSHTLNHHDSHFVFQSGWHYSGSGDKQALNLSIEKTTQGQTESWQDSHAMVATNFTCLQALLAPYFDVHIFEHDYEKIIEWQGKTGNAIFACVKK